MNLGLVQVIECVSHKVKDFPGEYSLVYPFNIYLLSAYYVEQSVMFIYLLFYFFSVMFN